MANNRKRLGSNYSPPSGQNVALGPNFSQSNQALPKNTVSVPNGATFDIDFTSINSLDSRFTFTRSSNATFINSQGYVQYADANLILQSESLETSPWTVQNGATVADVSIINPIGGGTATRLTSAGASNAGLQELTLAANIPHTVRFWVRGGTSTQMQFGYFSGGFQTASGITVVGDGTVTGTTLMTITGLSTATWTQVTFVLASPAASGSLLFYPDTASPLSAKTNFVWGVQVNRGSTASPYYRTTTSAYHGPRFDYDPTTLTSRGLLIEGSATNLAFRSQALNTSPWLNAGTMTVTGNGSGSPANDATSNTITWTNGTGAGSAWLQQNVAVSAGSLVVGTAYTWSVWLKSRNNRKVNVFAALQGVSGNREVSVDFSVSPPTVTSLSATGWTSVQAPTIVQYPNGWYKLITGGTLPSGPTSVNFGFSNSDAVPASGTNGFEAWGYQLEAGSGASSYIPTGASQGTRAIDICTMSNIAALNYNANGGTLFAHFSNNTEKADFAGSIAFNNSGNYAQRFRWGSGVLLASYFQTNGTSALGSNLNGSRTSFASAKAATSYSFDGTTTSTALSINGAQATTTPTSSATSGVSIATALALNSDNSSAGTDYPSIAIRSIKFWPTGLTMAQMNALTVNP